MDKAKPITAGMLLKIAGLVEALLVFITFQAIGSSPSSFWSANAFIIFFFSLLFIFMLIAMRGEKRKFTPSGDIFLIVLLFGLILPFFMIVAVARESVWIPLGIVFFYGFIIPFIFMIVQPYSKKGAVGRNLTWLDILLTFLIIYLLIASSIQISEHMEASPSFGYADNYIENIDDEHVRVYISVVNNGVSDAHNIELQYNGETVYTIEVLRGLSIETYVFTMVCHGDPYQDTYWEAVYGPNGTVDYVERPITRYYPATSAEISMVYNGEVVETITLYHNYDYYDDYYDDYYGCDALYLSVAGIGIAFISTRRKR